jgi:hypothetical protein
VDDTIDPVGRPERPLRVVQWTTGNVARQTVRAVLARPDLELVGVFAYSADKVGRDVAELVGLDEPVGVVATDDVEQLLGLEPDCVVYTPLFPDVDAISRLLRHGVNIVTSAAFLNGRSLGDEARATIEAAGRAGNATIFGSGMNPGYAQLLAGIAAGASMHVRHVKVVESVDVAMFAADANMDELGWGLPAGSPGHAEAVERAVAVFADGVDVLAGLLGVEVDERRCTVGFAHATADLDPPGRPIAAGHVAGIDVRWEGIVDGRPVVELHQRWVMSSRIEPAWTVEHGYLVEVQAEPNIRLKLDIWPHQEDLASLTTADFHAIGMTITGVPVVNAIAAVCAADPGIRTYADLPVITATIA